MGRLKQAALTLRHSRASCDEAGASGSRRPVFTAITAGLGAVRGAGGQDAAADVIATFVGVLGRLEARPPANRPVNSRKNNASVAINSGAMNGG